MKRHLIFIILLLIAVFVNCVKNNNAEEYLKYIKTLSGGCIDSLNSSKKNVYLEKDTVTWSISKGNLDLLIGFNGTCGCQYNTSPKIKNDSIFIDIIISQIGQQNCLCYYNYTFLFTGIINSHHYLVNIDNGKSFTGIIKP